MEHICPHCKKPVYDDEALLCLFCGGSLDRGRRFPSKPLFIVILLLLLLSFFLMVFRG